MHQSDPHAAIRLHDGGDALVTPGPRNPGEASIRPGAMPVPSRA